MFLFYPKSCSLINSEDKFKLTVNSCNTLSLTNQGRLNSIHQHQNTVMING